MKLMAEESIEKGIKKFPYSGILYSEYGLLFAERKQNKKAEEVWEKGIEKAPNYHLNYYHLAKSYFYSKRPFWAIIYGETFINMERYSQRTEEIKKVIFDGYKQLIANNQLASFLSEKEKKAREKGKKPFELKADLLYSELASLVLGGVDVDNILMLRSRFLLTWMQINQNEHPNYLYEYLNNMISNGYFEAYNQWLFGKVANKTDYLDWVKNNSTEYEKFEKYFNGLQFRFPISKIDN